MTSLGVQLLHGALLLLFWSYTLLIVTHFLLQTLFAHLNHRRFRRFRVPVPGIFPSVDVIVPVYNEDPDRLTACVESILAQDYPGRLRTFLADDGSPNRAELGPVYDRLARDRRVEVFRLESNRGKRHAQDAAFRRSSGEFVVTIDSDTEIAPDGVSRIIEAALGIRTVAAVTGDVGVTNQSDNLLTRLIGMRYWIAFHQERAAQSYFGSVLCCSGPFSVYRRDVLEDVWDRYVHQTFHHVACTYGDDRHLTNLVLAAGWDAVFDPRSHASTNAPTTMGTYLKQQLRWNKSFYRELLWTLTYVSRRPWYLSFEIAVQTLLPLLLTMAVTSAAVETVLEGPMHAARYLAMIAVMALIRTTYAIVRTRNLRFLLFVCYGLLHVAFLIPVRLRALSTLTDNRWGTRARRARAG